MNRIISFKFLSKTGILILFPSFFLKWFSCKSVFINIDLDLSYIDLLEEYEVSIACYYYLFFLTFLICVVLGLKDSNYFKLFLLLTSIFLSFIFLFSIFFTMADIGVHHTVDIPCDPRPGFLLNTLGLIIIAIGIIVRMRKGY